MAFSNYRAANIFAKASRSRQRLRTFVQWKTSLLLQGTRFSSRSIFISHYTYISFQTGALTLNRLRFNPLILPVIRFIFPPPIKHATASAKRSSLRLAMFYSTTTRAEKKFLVSGKIIFGVLFLLYCLKRVKKY